MKNQISPNWSYKAISDTVINLYHVALNRVSIEELIKYVPEAEYVKKQNDGSVVILLSRPYTPETIDKILSVLNSSASKFLDTPNHHYEVDPNIQNILKQWFLAFQGCLGLLLATDTEIKPYLNSQWQFINAHTGGIFFSPFTLFLYNDHPKIIHPITVRNYDARAAIEYIAAVTIRTMLKRLKEAQPGFEGLALLSMVEDKTNLTQKEIIKIINDKSYRIVNPKLSPFLETDH